jgi:hypothetical protein
VTTPVDFDGQAFGRTIEIENELPEDVLPSKSQTSDPLSAQELPGPVLRWCRVRTQLPRQNELGVPFKQSIEVAHPQQWESGPDCA